MKNDFDLWLVEEFHKAVAEVDMKSSPGLCQLALLGSTNGDIFKYVDGQCDPERVKYVKDIVMHRIQTILRGEESVDDVRVFVKPEPHKPEKEKEGRYRLISAISLIDTLIDRILFGWLQRRALTVVGSTPTLCGWTPMRGGWRYIRARFSNRSVMCLDKSSWDWTVQPYMIDLWKDFIIEMAYGHTSQWLTLVNYRFKQLFETTRFSFECGTVVQQQGKGIMKSGCFLTLLMNSVGQSFIHYLAAVRTGMNPMDNQPIVIGDDTVQRSFESLPEYVTSVATLGAKVKGFKVRNWVEFVGFAWADDVCVPAYWNKHLFKLQYCTLKDSIESYQMLYANEPVMFEFLQRIAAEVDPALVLSKEEAKAIFNG